MEEGPGIVATLSERPWRPFYTVPGHMIDVVLAGVIEVQDPVLAEKWDRLTPYVYRFLEKLR